MPTATKSGPELPNMDSVCPKCAKTGPRLVDCSSRWTATCPGVCQAWTDTCFSFAKHGPTPGPNREHWTAVGPVLSKLDRTLGPLLAQTDATTTRPAFTKTEPSLVKRYQIWAELGPTVSNLDRSWIAFVKGGPTLVQCCQHWTDIGLVLSNVDRVWSRFAKRGPEPAQVCPNHTDAYPFLSELDRSRSRFV